MASECLWPAAIQPHVAIVCRFRLIQKQRLYWDTVCTLTFRRSRVSRTTFHAVSEFSADFPIPSLDAISVMAIISLRWPRIPARIEYKIVALTFQPLRVSSSRYHGPRVPLSHLRGFKLPVLRCSAAASETHLSRFEPLIDRRNTVACNVRIEWVFRASD